MRRSTLDLLRCPTCAASSLVPDLDVPEPALIFGPVRCLGCRRTWSVNEGLIDLAPERARARGVQQAMELPWVARSWERYVRPAVDAVVTRGRLDRDAEYDALRAMLCAPPGPVIDLGCGPGLFLKRLVRDLPAVSVIGVDVSRPMIEEAMAQFRELQLAADFVRAAAPPLPFLDASLGGVLASGVLHFVADLDGLLAEARRTLKPRGRFVASTYEAPGGLARLHQGAGLFPRGEDALRAAAERAGFIGFQRLQRGPVLVWSAELP
ncbi:MAG: class I SAM-dependent methyltransferase [Myxococcaceae bacterium]|jgi:SAM-dependent methyltransferase|nr:class I SAM-dependent methyltransferase [Myxococcaceae bacterium]MCA3011117.1 class I SAM-dependent methyltransferase [Myxococcaceae bacterium]